MIGVVGLIGPYGEVSRMSKALSLDLRRRVVDTHRRGEGTHEEIARRFGMGVATLRRWVRRDEAGTLAFDASCPHGLQPVIETAKLTQFKEIVRADPGATNAKLAGLLAEQTGLQARASTIRRAVRRLAWGRATCLVASARDAESVRVLRAKWTEWQKEVVAARLVFIDEAGSTIAMTRTHARPPAVTRPPRPPQGIAALSRRSVANGRSMYCGP